VTRFSHAGDIKKGMDYIYRFSVVGSNNDDEYVWRGAPSQTLKMAAIWSNCLLKYFRYSAAERLEKLGNPPAADAPPETADIAAMRERLTDQVSQLEGLSKRVVLAQSTVDNRIGQIRTMQRERYASQLRSRGDSPFGSQLWVAAGTKLAPAIAGFGKYFQNWFRDQQAAGTLFANITLFIAAVGVSIGLMALFFLTRLRQQFTPDILATTSPSVLDKKRATALRTVGYGVLTALIAAPVFGVAFEVGLFADGYAKLAQRIYLGTITLVATWTYCSCYLTPHSDQWRRIPIGSRRAARLRLLLIGIFTLFVYDRVASAIIEVTGLGVDVKSIQAILSASLFAILLCLVCNAKLWRSTAAPGQEADANIPASVISPSSGRRYS